MILDDDDDDDNDDDLIFAHLLVVVGPCTFALAFGSSLLFI